MGVAGLIAHAAFAADETSSGSGTELAEVTVTAEKITQNIQSAPAAITAISGDELTTVGLDNISQMSGLFPSARFEPTGFSSHLYVRGIGAEQDRITVDQLVTMSMDGVLLPREMSSISLFDMRDIELLPGPQGTLYGASSVGGVLTLANNRPNETDENNLLLEGGNYGTFHVDDVQNLRASDVLSVRGAIDYSDHSAYETSGGWTADALTGRLGLLFKPSQAFSAYLWGLVVSDHSRPADLGTVSPFGGFIPGGDPWDIANACITVACNGFSNVMVPGRNTGQIRDYIVAGQFDWHLDGVTITDIPSILHNQTRQTFNAYVFPNLYSVDNHQLTNELKAGSDIATGLQWIVGLYLYQNEADQYFSAGTYDVPQFKLENIAPYGQLAYPITQQLRLTAGLRYNRTSKDGTFILPHSLPETSATWSSLDWKVGLQYNPKPSVLLYLTTQTGSSPGTLDGQDPTPQGRPSVTQLTKLYSLTAGVKTTLLGDRLQLNDEIYYYDYRDFLIQTIICGNAECSALANVYLNAPRLASYGDQLDSRWLVTPHDQLSISVGLNSTKTGHWITNAGADLSDQTLFEAPQMTTTLSGQHSFDLSNGGTMLLRVDTYLSSGYWGDFETNPGGPVHISYEYQPSFTNTGISLTYHSVRDRWTLGLWAINLENEAQLGPGGAFPYPTPVGAPFSKVGGVAAIVNPPRTYGVRFTAILP